MDITYINPFITSTIDTFKTMLNVEVKPGKPTVKRENIITYDVSGIIGLAGEVQGCIAISFPRIVALKVVSTMLGMQLEITDTDLTDGIGEIANIIAGNAKQYLDDKKISISLPNVIVGKEHKISTQKGIQTLIVPFSSTIGEFTMEVSLK